MNPHYAFYTLAYWRAIGDSIPDNICKITLDKYPHIRCGVLNSSVCMVSADGVGSASDAMNKNKKRSIINVSLDSLLAKSFPLHSLFCCGSGLIGRLNVDSPSSLQRGENAFDKFFKNLILTDNRELPSYIKSLLRSVYVRKGAFLDSSDLIDVDDFSGVKSRNICIYEAAFDSHGESVGWRDISVDYSAFNERRE